MKGTKNIAPVLLLAALAGCAPLLARGGPSVAGTLAGELDAILADPAVAHAHVGVLVRSPESGEVVYAKNPDRLFVPASNVKILTAAAALTTLGPDYRYRTTIAAAGPVRNGTLEGPLLVFGTGDPTLSSRFLDDPRDVFRAWADSLRANGITRIQGPIVGVDTAFTDAHLGAGWAWDDLTEGYAAEFGALLFNEGVIRLDVFPSSTPLGRALLVLTPPIQSVRVINDTRTVLAGSLTALRVLRDESGRGILLRGEVAADEPGATLSVSVPDPTLYFVSALRETLREQGIAAEGMAVTLASMPPEGPLLDTSVPLFRHESPPLAEILPRMLKPSQNAIAEVILRTMGREVRQDGSAAGGAAVVDSLMTVWGIEKPSRIADGSGLSRYNLLSPAVVTAVLERMEAGPYRDLWLASLPVAGVDGTLQERMREAPLRGQVVAKTGTLTGVSALSGYLTTTAGERLVFSMMLNHRVTGAEEAHRVMEETLRRIATAR